MKNLILITMDAIRPDHLSCYGYDKIKTEAIDSIAKDGVLFKNVIATSCLTPVAHASILSGKNPNKTGVRDPFCKIKTNMISNILKDHGYATAGFVGIDFLGKELGFASGFDLFDEPTKETGWQKKQYKKNNQTMDTIWGNWWIPKMLNFIKNNKSKPFFVWGHYFKAHYHAEKQMLEDKLIKEGRLSENAYYDAKIEYMDNNLFKPMVYMLKDFGIYEDTTIVITSDHGESFQYGHPQHRTLYEQDLKIPLIIKDKSLIHMIVGKTARSIDIVPTILYLFGIKSKEKFDGVSLFPLYGLTPPPNIAYSEELYEERGEGALQSIRTNDIKIIYNRTKNTVEAYDLIKDPKEEHNIFDKMYQSAITTNLTIEEEERIKKRLEELGYLE